MKLRMIKGLSSKKRKRQFEKIYKKNLWGGKKGQLYSGDGSYREDLVNAYVNVVKDVIKEKGINSILEIGCGDFNVAKNYASDVDRYVGIDVSQSVIDNNIKHYQNNGIRFYKVDAVDEEIPKAQLCLIRQVLQHLNNDEISSILSKIKMFEYVIIAETQYKKELTDNYNLDIDKSRITRRNKKSGVYLEEEPFLIKCSKAKVVSYSDTVDFVIYLVQG